MKKVLILGTGGTISCTARQKEGRKPVYGLEEILQFVPRLKKVCRLESDTPIQEGGKPVYVDSTNMQPEYMAQVANRIYKAYKKEGVDGVVVLGGTDTMEESGADLTFLLANKKIPVVLTGSMKPIDARNTDAKKNLLDAARFATEGPPGTYLVFNGRVISAGRAKKIHPAYVDAFRSINIPELGRYVREKFVSNPAIESALKRYQHRQKNQEMRLRSSIELSTHLLELYRGIRPALIRNFFESGYRGIIIEAFGTGGIPNLPKYRSLIPQIRTWGYKRLIGITSKTFTGQTTDDYEVNTGAFKAGAISLYDMLPLTALSKANWLFGQHPRASLETIKKLMWHPFELEITEDRVPEKSRLTAEEAEELLDG